MQLIPTQQYRFQLFFSLLFYALALPFNYGGISIDSSWHEALVMAINKQEVFGKDFIFNYGPLGYFNSRVLPQSVSVWLMFFLDTFILLNFIIINKLAFQKAKEKWKIAALISVLILLPWGFIADCSFTFFYFFLFWLFYSQQQKNTLTLFLAALISVLIFYVKVNLSIVSYGTFYLSLIYFWWSKIISFRTVLILFGLQVALTFGLSFLLHVDIPAYLYASLKIIDAYQDAMAAMLLSLSTFIVLLFFEALILLVILWYIVKNFGEVIKHQNLYFFVLILLSWFLCFKQANTAVGTYNIFGFFLFMPPLTVLIYLFRDFNKTMSFGRVVILTYVLSISATQLIRFYMGEQSLKGYLLTYPPSEVAQKTYKSFTISHLIEIIILKNPMNYFKKILNYDYENNFKNKYNNEQLALPQEILTKIGNESVDLMQTDISYLFFNRLNYVHRPVIQTYQANSTWLAQKNAQKYNSDSAPKFVLFQVSSFRGQNPFWIDNDANLVLLTHYKMTDSVFVKNIENKPDTLLLLKRKDKNSFTNIRATVQKTFQLNQEITIDSTEHLLYFDASIHYSLLGKMARLIFHPPYLYCNLTYEDNSVRTYRVVNSILKGGVLINRSVSNQNDAAKFFLSKGKENLMVKKINFWAKHPWGFKQNFKGNFRAIEVT